MSSISLSFKMLLAASAVAGLTMLACGEETPSGGGDEDKDDTSDEDKGGKEKDGGKDAGKDSGKDARAATVYKKEGDECDPKIANGIGAECEGCDADRCGLLCDTDKNEYGECQDYRDIASKFLGNDAGAIIDQLRDAGFGGLFGDAAIKNKDGSVGITLPDGGEIDIPKTECPAEVECSEGSTGLVQGIISQFTMGVPYCADPASGLPPACTDQQDCTNQGFKAAFCLDSMFLGKFCVQTCK